MKRRFKTAFILGAGFGKRLRPFTESLPKPLIPLWGKPLICYILDRLIKYGFERFVINTHHAHEAYFTTFPNQTWRERPLVFNYESILLDTGGGLKNIEHLLTEDEAILCHNGDVLTTMPYDRLIEFHNEKRPYFTMALRSESPQKHILLDEYGNVKDIRNILKKKNGKRLHFTGVYAVETECLKYIEPSRPISLIDILIEFIKSKPGKVKGVVIDEGNWYEVGTVESYNEIKKLDPRTFFLQ
ncbi:MAG: sugar phosphate nucleotidyltransferase [Deltaproteobacteria bacterium]|nr:sugar phosphate nucleotidyltransferase [Deltaproteobacteria bacterium]